MTSIQDTTCLVSYTTVAYDGCTIRHLFCDGQCSMWHPQDRLLSSHVCPSGCLWCVTCVTFHQPGTLCRCIECERFRLDVRLCYQGLQKHMNTHYVSADRCTYCIRCQTELKFLK